MKVSNSMKRIIEKLAEKHGVDLSTPHAHFRLDMAGYDRLCVENIGLNRISVAHYFEQVGDLVADPEIVFWVSPQEKNWFPVGVKQVFGGDRTYAFLSDDGSRIVSVVSRMQADLASFANIWAKNIVDQLWLANGVKHVWAVEAVSEAEPLEMFEQPDLETLIEWFEEGGCEALDGCWVESDGRCPHGHPSWFLHLGMI